MNPKSILPLAFALLSLSASVARSADSPQRNQPDSVSTDTVRAFKSKLLDATTRHLNLLIGADGSVISLKGKSSAGQEAFAFYLTDVPPDF